MGWKCSLIRRVGTREGTGGFASGGEDKDSKVKAIHAFILRRCSNGCWLEEKCGKVCLGSAFLLCALIDWFDIGQSLAEVSIGV